MLRLQVLELELMKPEDYDQILHKGWLLWMGRFIMERIDKDLLGSFMEFIKFLPGIVDKWYAKDVPVIMSGAATIPYENICGARTLTRFIFDMYQNGDQVEKVMDAALPFMAPLMIAMTKYLGLPAMWIGGWRAASEILSPPLWDRFVWPYLERVAFEVIDSGIIPWFHLDSDWTRDLGRFKALPKGQCVLSLDGSTDIRKAKEILGDHMCIAGDVPASLLVLGFPDEVYEYCTELIRDMGPNGFILHSGCDIPADAKLENVQAMVAAATGK